MTTPQWSHHDVSDQSSNRRALRRLVDCQARLSGSAMDAVTVTVTNISRAGCRIETLRRFPVGSALLITLPGLAPLGAQVRWSDGDRSGLRFNHPLGEAVMNHLVALHGPELISIHDAR